VHLSQKIFRRPQPRYPAGSAPNCQTTRERCASAILANDTQRGRKLAQNDLAGLPRCRVAIHPRVTRGREPRRRNPRTQHQRVIAAALVGEQVIDRAQKIRGNPCMRRQPGDEPAARHVAPWTRLGFEHRERRHHSGGIALRNRLATVARSGRRAGRSARGSAARTGCRRRALSAQLEVPEPIGNEILLNLRFGTASGRAGFAAGLAGTRHPGGASVGDWAAAPVRS
jgi:hypothetical protein